MAQRIGEFAKRFKKLCDQEDGVNAARLLDTDRGHIPLQGLVALESSQVQEVAEREAGPAYGQVLAMYLNSLRAREQSDNVHELECMLTSLKTWTTRYIEADGSANWMMPVLMLLCPAARRVALQLDQAKKSEASPDKYMKYLVDFHRDLFQKLNKERMKRAGNVWVCCELLRAYFKLGQITQCAFLLKAFEKGDGFNPNDMPKAVAVTFYFFWGKHCVFTNKLKEADEKLTWAFNRTPERSKANRQKILLYLVPCKLRFGVLPTQALLQSHDLGMFEGIVGAIREGNLKLFTSKMEEYAADFIKMGTYLCMMKLKFMVLRNLCKGVHSEVRRKLGDGKTSQLDITPFEHVFNWQDDCDADETACLLSELIYLGAVKGYLSHEKRKVVFAKEKPFPPPSEWRF
eukprot:TRINITY_DN32367_c0_g1_i1.p1 TRINITY_DN32367_c0_g1~~TRINITY_DN32367_c0_g1_i1.p1  ORF type:complete len:423 (+),score=85.06 TRINITY_DN32367_c0_g1_i1:61-1269(+)